MHYTPVSWIILASFLVAVYYTFRLAKETKYERYWIFFLISAVFMGMHHIVIIPHNFGLINNNTLEFLSNIGELIGALAIAYAAYGISKSMRNIRQKLREE